VKVVTAGKGEITLQDFITGCQTEIDTVNYSTDSESCLTVFSPILNDCHSIIIPEAEMAAIVFVSGYVGFKLKCKIPRFDCLCPSC
jgi:hypothetical protein